MTQQRHIVANLRLIAIDNCMSEGFKWYAEKAYRYYSHHYHTPLHVARNLLTPFEVILCKMEDEMDDATVEELQDLKSKILDLPKDLDFMRTIDGEVPEKTELSDDEWIAAQERLLKESSPKSKVEKSAKNIVKAASTLADALQNMKDQVRDLESEIDKPLTFGKDK